MMAKTMGQAEGEKWPRFQVDLPPEMAEELMRLHRADMGVNASAATRQGLLRRALLEYWQSREPEPAPDIEGTAVDLDATKALEEMTAAGLAPFSRVAEREDPEETRRDWLSEAT